MFMAPFYIILANSTGMVDAWGGGGGAHAPLPQILADQKWYFVKTIFGKRMLS